MTAAAIALRGSVARLRVAVSTDVIAVGVLAVFVVGLAALTWGTWGDLDSDTGFDLTAGARVADGELPYRDFVYYYGPLAPFLAGLAALIGGAGIGPAVALGLTIALAIVGLTYALARIVLPPIGALLAASLTAAVAFIPDNYGFVLPHTFAATLGTLLVLVLLLALWRFASTGGSAWLLVMGGVLGLTMLTKPEPAAAGVLAVAVWIALRAGAGGRPWRELALVAAPALAIPAVVYGAFLAIVPAHRLVFENLYPVDLLKVGGSALVKVRMPMTAESVVLLGGRLALYAVGVAALVVFAALLERGGRLRRPLLAGGALVGLLALAVLLVKPDGFRDGLYYVYGWVPAGAVIAVVVLARRYRRRSGEWTAVAQLELAAAVALAVLAATTYGAFVMNGYRPQMSVYYIPFVAILLARVHLVDLARSRTAVTVGTLWVALLVLGSTALTLKDARAESVQVSGPGGMLRERPAEAALYAAALTEIRERTAPGEKIFVAPILTGLTVLSQHESALPQLSTLPGAFPTPADERVAIARLERAGVRLAITDPREWKGYGQTSFGRSFDRVLAGWLSSKFDRVATLRAPGGSPRTLDVWLKRRAQ